MTRQGESRRRAAILALVTLAYSCSGICSVRSPPADMTARIAVCQRTWQTLYGRLHGNFSALQAQWLSQRTHCQGTGIYEYYRAVLLQSLGKLQAASRYLASVRRQNLPDARVLDILYFSIRFSEALSKGGPNSPELPVIHQEIQRAANEYPDTYVLTEDARELVVLHDYSRAVASAKRAADLDGHNWAAREWLVDAAARVHMCRAAQPYIVTAIEFQQTLLSQKDFMYSAASCYLEIGALPTARNVLLSLSRRNSAVIQDPHFQQLWNMADKGGAPQ